MTRFDAAYRAGNTPWDIPGPQPAFAALTRADKISGRVLDPGCGTGELSLHLAAAGLAVTGIDASDTAIRCATRKAVERGISATFIHGDACALEAVEEVDTVVDNAFLHVLDEAERPRYLDSLSRVVRSGGSYHLLCFSERATVEGPHRFTRDDISDLLSRHWHIESTTATFFDTIGGHRGTDAWLTSATRL